MRKLFLFLLLLLSLSFSLVYFTSPTPTNNTNNFTYPIVLNVSTNETSFTNCYIEIDGTNQTGTASGTSCSYTIPYASTYFNHTYTVNAFMNETTWCYQESANVSTVCGGLDTGSYGWSVGWTDEENTSDGDWGTYAISPVGGGSEVYNFTYVVPENATSGKVEIKFYNNPNMHYENVSIPTQCWNVSGNVSLAFVSYSMAFSLYCRNATDWDLFKSWSADGVADVLFYEEAIWWNFTNITQSNETYSIPYYGCGKVNDTGTMIGNVSTTETCMTMNATGITFDCGNYEISGDNGTSDYGIYDTLNTNFAVQNCKVKNFGENYKVAISGAISGGISFTNITSTGATAYGLKATGTYTDRISFTNVQIYNTSNYFYSGAGHPIIFTNITVGYNETVGKMNAPSYTGSDTYYIEYLSSANGLLQPTFISISNSGDNSYEWTHLASNITLYTGDCTNYTIYRKTGFPTTLAGITSGGNNFTPTYSSCSGNTWTFDVSGFSGYGIDYKQAYFQEPSPNYNEVYLYDVVEMNFSIDLNMTGCYFEADGINYTGILSADNQSCSGSFNLTTEGVHTFKGWSNISGLVLTTNDARNIWFMFCVGGTSGGALPYVSPPEDEGTEVVITPSEGATGGAFNDLIDAIEEIDIPEIITKTGALLLAITGDTDKVLKAEYFDFSMFLWLILILFLIGLYDTITKSDLTTLGATCFSLTFLLVVIYVL